MSNYSRQDRGDAGAYAAYFAGMDKTAQQKIALTTAHFPVRGKVADMGCGSGRTTFDLANLYEGLELIGVDVNETSVGFARETHQRKNLSFVAGDIANRLFADGELSGILNSSVLHHVTSFNRFSVARVRELLDNQVASLAEGGVLIIRDFVVPRGPQEVDLEISEADGAAELFEVFARGFRSSQNLDGPVPYEKMAARRPGFSRVRLSLRAATEFVLRKDYRTDWDVELLEEYTYFTQEDFERELSKRGLRILTSAEIHNPWIVKNRFEGKIYLSDTSGTLLPYPPTNYLIAAEKVSAARGVRLAEAARRAAAEPKFLRLEHLRHGGTGQVYELAYRPNHAVDLVPWFEKDGRIYVLARTGFPRPITNAALDGRDLSGAHAAGYFTEPLSALVGEETTPERSIRHLLVDRAGIGPDKIKAIGERAQYFTSPGGINECVFAYFVEIAPLALDAGDLAVPNYSSFTSSGSIRPFDAAQLLRASQAGGMYDARLELNVYRLLRAKKRPLGPWIGAQISATDRAAPARVRGAKEVFHPAAKKVFTAVSGRTATFLDVRRGQFRELNAGGDELAKAELEYVLPRGLSASTIVALPFVKSGGKIFVGIETRELPAVETHLGTAAIAVVPAMRLPRWVHHLEEATEFAAETLEKEMGLKTVAKFELGGRYFPSAGVTPEVVYPFVFEVDASTAHHLDWVELGDAYENSALLLDAHSLTAIQRFAHALS